MGADTLRDETNCSDADTDRVRELLETTSDYLLRATRELTTTNPSNCGSVQLRASDYAQRLESLSKELRGEIAEREGGSVLQHAWPTTTGRSECTLGSFEKPSEAETMSSTPAGTTVEDRDVADRGSTPKLLLLSSCDADLDLQAQQHLQQQQHQQQQQHHHQQRLGAPPPKASPRRETRVSH